MFVNGYFTGEFWNSFFIADYSYTASSTRARRFVGGGGGPLYDNYDERFDGPRTGEALLQETRVHAYTLDVMCTTPMSQVIVTVEKMDAKSSAKIMLVSVKTEDDDGSS